MDQMLPNDDQRHAEPASLPSSPVAANRVIDDSSARAEATAGRRWPSTVGFVVVALMAALGAIALWLRVPFGSVWIGAAAITTVVLAGLITMTRPLRSRHRTARAR